MVSGDAVNSWLILIITEYYTHAAMPKMLLQLSFLIVLDYNGFTSSSLASEES